ncbi:MAG: hypothetical protein K2O10_02820, partial [Muribaculaceae bacterium]|nr:hypothetical protein [Muribaculaceae bacterium]
GTPANEAQPAKKLTYAEQRERSKMLARGKKKVDEAEAKIAEIEAEIAATEAEIAAGNVENDIFTRHQKLNRDLETAMSLWELAEQELTDLTARFS